jgi:hypothetical protein
MQDAKQHQLELNVESHQSSERVYGLYMKYPPQACMLNA